MFWNFSKRRVKNSLCVIIDILYKTVDIRLKKCYNTITMGVDGDK